MRQFTKALAVILGAVGIVTGAVMLAMTAAVFLGKAAFAQESDVVSQYTSPFPPGSFVAVAAACTTLQDVYEVASIFKKKGLLKEYENYITSAPDECMDTRINAKGKVPLIGGRVIQRLFYVEVDGKPPIEFVEVDLDTRAGPKLRAYTWAQMILAGEES